jgi:hypothetical protein
MVECNVRHAPAGRGHGGTSERALGFVHGHLLFGEAEIAQEALIISGSRQVG